MRWVGRPLVLSVLTFLAVWLSPTHLAAAHGAALTAYLTFDPPAPKQGQTTTLHVHVVDAYSSPVTLTALHVELADTHAGNHSSATAHPNPDASLTARLPYTGGSDPVIAITTRLPDGDWSGQLQLAIDPGAAAPTEWGVILHHQDNQPITTGSAATAASKRPPWFLIPLVLVLWLMLKRRRVRPA